MDDLLDQLLEEIHKSGKPWTAVAERLGYRRRLHDWASRKHKPSLEVFQKACDAAGFRLRLEKK